MKKASQAAALVFALSLCAILIFEPKDCSAAVVNAIDMCLKTLVPSLFPFLFLSQFVLKAGLAHKLSKILGNFTEKILKLPACASGALVLGFLGGYPIGAKYTSELCKNGYISADEGEEILLCCNNCGPAFFFGVLGSAVFSSIKIAALLWISHILGAFAALLILKRKSIKPKASQIQATASSLPSAFCSASWEAVVSIAKISAYVMLFSVFTLLFNKLTLKISPNNFAVTAALKGVLELTSGIVSLSDVHPKLQVCLAAFFTGWGGICVHIQTMSVIQGTGIRLKRYIAAKMLQGAFSAVFMYSILKLFTPSSVNAVLVQSKAGMLDITAKSGALFILPWAILALLIQLCIRKEKDDDKL